MAYTFPLATLLRFRENLEHRSWLELQASNQQLQRVEASLAQLELERIEWRNERLSVLGKGIKAAELEICGQQYYQRKRLELERDLLPARQQAAAKLAEFYRARQKRQVLENLYLRGKNVYDTERARREQARVDELFLIRRKRPAEN
jgi:flagellar export protein FliJ